jgi:hypothetical protein
MSSWWRVEFDLDIQDTNGYYNPCRFPPPGPYWAKCFRGEHFTVIAYVQYLEQIFDYWPDAKNLRSIRTRSIVFSTEYPKPIWWENNKNEST